MNEPISSIQEETYRDRIASVTEKGKRKWIYAQQPTGRFYKARTILAWLYLIVFFTMPFIKVNGMPFIMLNFFEGKFILFSKIFWPQDFIIFALGMITMVIFIALFTVVYGRLFCGWVCPQTIFMEFVFRKLEWWIEGTPTQQKKRAQHKQSFDFLWRRIIKYVLFFVLSFLIANTFLSYIVGIDELKNMIAAPISENFGLLSGLLVFTLLFFSVYAFVRDLVCTTVCPYGRLQSVLFDKNTMLIAYDYNRGEPRGKLKKHTENNSRPLGDCVDCKLCVNVCPTGIDIRNGVQMECIGCTACADACDSVMLKLNRPTGLIRYASENEIQHGQNFRFSGKVLGYSIMLFLLLAAMSVMIFTRRSIDTSIARVKGQLYQEVPEGKLSNLYNAKIINKTHQPIKVHLKLNHIEGGEIKLIGIPNITLKPESINEIFFFVILPDRAVKQRSQKIKIDVYSEENKLQTIKTTFLGPFS